MEPDVITILVMLYPELTVNVIEPVAAIFTRLELYVHEAPVHDTRPAEPLLTLELEIVVLASWASSS